MVSTILLLGLLGVATVTDVLRHRIYNWTTYSGSLAAIGLNAVGSMWLSMQGGNEPLGRWLESLGWIGFSHSLLGFLACGFILLVCFVFFKVGGGDVKMMAMLGAFLGPDQGIEAMLWTFVLGACMGLILLVWRMGPLRLIIRVFGHLFWTIRLGRFSPLTDEERSQLQSRLFLAPSSLAAVLIVRFSLLDLLAV